MKVCIYGAGAIGGYLGVGLAESGIDVCLIARGAHLAAMRENGLTLQIDGNEKTVRVPCSDDAAQFGPQDFVIIAQKSHSIPDAVESMLPLLNDDTTIVTSSNGLPYWFFDVDGIPYQGIRPSSVDPGGKQLRFLGPRRAVGCVVFPATEIVAPGVVRHEHGGKFPIGEPDGRRSQRIEQLHSMLEPAGFEAPIRSDIRNGSWLKLWGNLCFNPVSAPTGAPI